MINYKIILIAIMKIMYFIFYIFFTYTLINNEYNIQAMDSFKIYTGSASLGGSSFCTGSSVLLGCELAMF